MKLRVLKKITGTTLVTLIFIFGVIVATGNVQALYKFIGNDFDGTGRVVSVGSSSFEIVTSGSTWPFTMVTSPSTSYQGGYTSLTSVVVGDSVRVKATKTTGDFTVDNVKKLTALDAYGTPCQEFVLQTSVFERPINNYFFATKSALGIKIQFDSSLTVVGGTFDDLLPGTEIIVSGLDCVTEGVLLAKQINIVTNVALDKCNEYASIGLMFRNTRPLLSNNESDAFSPLMNVTVPTGTYTVVGVSWDNHKDSPWDKQPKEQWRITGFKDGVRIYDSPPTADLPDGVDFQYNILDTAKTLSSGVDQIQFGHYAYPDAGVNSIYPACVAFIPVSG